MKKKPLALQIVDGTYREDRHGPLDEQLPVEISSELAPPDWLDELATEEWRGLVPRLEKIGLLATVDKTVVAAHCAAVARWRHAQAQVDEHGMLIHGDRGALKLNPAVQVVERSAREAVRTGAELGMTPSARLGMRAPRLAPKTRSENGTASDNAKTSAARRLLD